MAPSLPLFARAVELHHLGVHRDLVLGGVPLEPGADHLVDVPDRLEHPLAAVAGGVAVPELHRLVLPGRGSARHRRPPPGPAREHHFGFDGRVAPAVQDLAGVHFDDGRHGWIEGVREVESVREGGGE